MEDFDFQLGVEPSKQPCTESENSSAGRGSIAPAPAVRGGFKGFFDTFKRSTATPPAAASANGNHGGLPQTEKINADEEHGDAQRRDGPAEGGLAHDLKGRHLQMIAIAGCIGTGLFIGAGSALAEAGPASLLLGFSVTGIMLFCTMHALGELAVTFPVAGSFAAYADRFIDPAWAFALGWNYALNWLISLPIELIAASITVSFWEGATGIHPAVWVTLFWLTVTIFNLFGVKWYGESEFIFSIIKVIAIIGFIIVGICIDVGASPTKEYIGARYWKDPGPFNNGFRGFCSVLITAAFALSGTELVGLAAAESANPRKSLPSATKQVFWRIVLFNMMSLIIIGLLIPYNHPLLLSSSSTADANASPFVIAIRAAHIHALPSILNAVVLISVLSVGNSAIYGSSRTLAALADQGQAPKIFGYIDRAGRPLVSVLFSCCFGVLCYLCVAGAGVRNEAFGWLLALAGLSTVVMWASICLCHIRFRRAWKVQGRSLEEITWRASLGTFGSWLGFVFNCLVLIAAFWIGLAPAGYATLPATHRIKSFFQLYLSITLVIPMYIAFKLVKRTSIRRARDIDLVTGVRVEALEVVEDGLGGAVRGEGVVEGQGGEGKREGKWRRAWRGVWKRVGRLFC